MPTEYFDIDRWKIRLDNGQPVGHYAGHCLFPVLLNNILLYVRGSWKWAIVARNLADNQEQVLNLPGGQFPGITYKTDGRYVAFAYPQIHDKGYDPQDFHVVIYDTQAKQFVTVAQKYIQEGVTYPQVLWLHTATRAGEFARHIRWLTAEIEYTTVELGSDNLAARYKRYTRAINMADGSLGAAAVETSVQVPAWL